MKQLVVGLLAHVDAGKTTLTEGLLFESGSLKALGRVDHGTAFLDTAALEKARGITIFSKQARLTAQDAQGNPMELTLMDTPGHVDFSPEMERCLQVLDCAILVISGRDGVESHTETLWQLLNKHKIPTLLFVNKMDLPDLEREEILAELKRTLHSGCVDCSPGQDPEVLGENVGLCSEELLERFLEQGRLLEGDLAQAFSSRSLFPCYFGSALLLEGVGDLLSAVATYGQGLGDSHPQLAGEAFGAQVFKITRDPQGNRLSHVKVTSGALAVKDFVTVGEKEEEIQEKVNEIRLYSGEKYKTAFSVGPGSVCTLLGLQETQAGDSLGVARATLPPVLAPVLTYTLELPPEKDPAQALRELKQLQEEDPALELHWLPEKQSLQIRLMGDVQLEVLAQLIQERFGLAVQFSQRAIIYRETISNQGPVEGVGHYEPLRHYAEVQLHLQAGAPDSGLVFASTCPTTVLEQNYQNLVLTHLKERIHPGVLTGSPITDLKITLTSGRAHQKHTEGGDFREATYRALRQGLMEATSLLLEPWFSLSLLLPQDCVGRAMSDVQRMGGQLSPPEFQGELCRLTGTVPVSQLGNYSSTLTGYSQGRGKLTTALLGYRPCPNPAPVIACLGYQPLRDLTAPADSIFCSHGAGFSVPWDQVKAHMHTESTLPSEETEEEAPQVVRQRVQRYASQLAEDKDLMEIFQRTYGTIQREKLGSFSPSSSQAEGFSGQDPGKTKYILQQQKGEDFLLVDGYNIIFAWEELQDLAQDNMDSARIRLQNLLCNYQGFRRCQVILVFDAYRVKGGQGSVENYHNISVVYTKEAETADMYIEKVTHQLGRTHRVRVATSDGLEQMIILGHGAFRLSAEHFLQEIRKMEAEIAKFLG